MSVDEIIEQIDKQLNKLVDVIKVTDLAGQNFIERELILAKIAVNSKNRSELIQIAEIFKGKIVCVYKNEITVELSGDGRKIENFIELLTEFKIIELVRTGRVAISRDPGITEECSRI